MWSGILARFWRVDSQLDVRSCGHVTCRGAVVVHRSKHTLAISQERHSSLRWALTNGKSFCGYRNLNLSFFWEILDSVSSRLAGHKVSWDHSNNLFWDNLELKGHTLLLPYFPTPELKPHSRKRKNDRSSVWSIDDCRY